MSAGKSKGHNSVHNMLSFMSKIDMYVCAEEIIGSIHQKLLAGVERQESWTGDATSSSVHLILFESYLTLFMHFFLN